MTDAVLLLMHLNHGLVIALDAKSCWTNDTEERIYTKRQAFAREQRLGRDSAIHLIEISFLVAWGWYRPMMLALVRPNMGRLHCSSPTQPRQDAAVPRRGYLDTFVRSQSLLPSAHTHCFRPLTFTAFVRRVSSEAQTDPTTPVHCLQPSSSALTLGAPQML